MSQQKNDTQDPRLQGIPILGLEDATNTLRIVCVDSTGCLIVSGGGGGTGTVTSIAGGTGITNTPEPITTVGTVDLDINSLTTESSLAAGDLFAFVDVDAAGTPIAQQRKVTLADLAAFIGAGGGATCATAPELLCLGGRTGTTNDPTISTDGLGSIHGSALAAPAAFDFLSNSGLNLNAGIGTVLGPSQFINIDGDATTIRGGNTLIFFGLRNQINNAFAPVPINDIPGVEPSSISLLSWFGSLEVGDDSMGGPSFQMVTFTPTISNPPGVAKILASSAVTFQFTGTFLVDGAACTVGGVSPFLAFPNFVTQNGGTLSVATVNALDIRYTADAGVTFGTTVGVAYEGPTGGTVSGDDTAYMCVDALATVSGQQYSLQSQGSARLLSHAGPGKFGSLAPLTGAYILEVIGDAHISGKLTLDGAIDPTDITYSGQLHSTIATGTAPIVAASTTLVTNLNAELHNGMTSAAIIAAGGAASPVTSVFGRTGVVAATTNDYTWAQIDKTTSALADIATRPHSALTGIGIDDHHARDHVLATSSGLGATHTVSGLTAGQVLRASSVTAAAFAALQAVDIPDLSATYALAARTISTTAPLTGGGDLSANRTFAMAAATGSVDGYLTAANFTTFNAKVAATRAINTTAGDLTGGGDLSANRTLGLANAGPGATGPIGNGTTIPVVTIDAKGRVTALTSASVTATAPSGSDTQVQFNDSGAFGGDAGLVYNKTTDRLTVGTLTTTLGLIVGTTITSYANRGAAENGTPFTFMSANLTGQTANVGATTLVASATEGRYRLSCYIAITTAASISSTLPSVVFQYTDPTDNVVKNIVVTPTNTGNTTATAQGGSAICDAKIATAIKYLTTGYASTAAGMAFKIFVTLEAM